MKKTNLVDSCQLTVDRIVDSLIMIYKLSTVNCQLSTVFLLLFAFGCKNNTPKTLFVSLDSKQTGIEFENTITESDSLNIFNSEFIYNGGGVGIGDLNGDGLQDIFFTGNQVENKLYLNKGNLKFEDITVKSGISKKTGVWSQGINMIDINRDGKQDIYVCNTFNKNSELRKNQLFVNQGNDAQGIPHFLDLAAEYGLADTTHSSSAQFFDYDNDGDLDVFIAVNFMDTKYPNQYFPKVLDGSSPNRDVLYRNDWSAKLGHPVFTDVSIKSGIKLEGYSHSCLINDFNEDGYPDIYVANDYVTNDLIYINQKNGTFKNEAAAIFKHQSASAMGSDVADINNDGKLDFFTTEMLPYTNKRKKLFLNANNYTTYTNNDKFGFEYQYARNTMQLNRGINPTTGLPVFSDVSFLGDVQETEWSWTPLLADFDNDGNRDIFVTNGFPRDVTDHDFGAYRSTISYLIPELELQKTIPQIKVPKFIFKNEGNLHFTDQSKAWGVDKIGFSNGAAYADLDNDGDLDLVVNNIDQKAFVFENRLRQESGIRSQVSGKQEPDTRHLISDSSNYVRLNLVGSALNPDAIGAKVTVFFDGKMQAASIESGRGYASTSEHIIHFGIGAAAKVDSVQINWGQVLGIKYQQTVSGEKIKINSETRIVDTCQLSVVGLQLPVNFKPTTLNGQQSTVNYKHSENDFIDFNFQKTIPHKFSQYGPSISVGDVNGDGLEDFYIGGSAGYDGTWFLQTKEGKFNRKDVAYKLDPKKQEEELGTLLFDADGDGDLDLYIVHGSGQYVADSPFYQDVLCINDGKGNFKIAPNALPKETSCGQVVKAVDIDGDGDLDLFVGGRVLPNAYPKTDKSYILRNDSKEKDKPIFTDITAEICPELSSIGLISDAIFTDFNGDGKPDLILAGEWMPVTFFQHVDGKFVNVTSQSGIADKKGWWTSITAGDFDNDGDIDYVVGNFGKNTYFKCDEAFPMTIYAKDFDKNGLYDPFISCYFKDSTGKKQEYFYHTRDDMIKQLVLIKRKFQTYGSFGLATVDKVFTAEELKDAQIMKANWMYSSYIENLGNGKFKMTALPYQAQIAPVYGMIPYDFDNDGLLDVAMVGNDFGMELLQGRADGFNGLILKNLGGGSFKAVELNESGFYVPGDGRALTKINMGDCRDVPLWSPSNQRRPQGCAPTLFLASQNQGDLKVFSPNSSNSKIIYPQKGEIKAQIILKNGQKRTQEFYWGHSFLSQQTNSISVDNTVQEVLFLDRKNAVVRRINTNQVQ